MVHALKEAWRVLRPGGIMIDLRPLSIDTPLLIFTRAGWKSAGLPDQSPDRIHEILGDRAVRSLVRQGLFFKLKHKYFQTSYYWQNLEDFGSTIEERWKEDIIISEKIWQKARLLSEQGSAEQKVRLPFHKKIVLYHKTQQ